MAFQRLWILKYSRIDIRTFRAFGAWPPHFEKDSGGPAITPIMTPKRVHITLNARGIVIMHSKVGVLVL